MLCHVRLCNPMECSLLGSSDHRIFPGKNKSGLPFPPSRDLSDPGIEPMSPASPAWQVDSLPLSHLGSPTVHELILKCSRTQKRSLLCSYSKIIGRTKYNYIYTKWRFTSAVTFAQFGAVDSAPWTATGTQ